MSNHEAALVGAGRPADSALRRGGRSWSGGRDSLPGKIAVVQEDGVPVVRLTGEIDSFVVSTYEGVPAAPAGGTPLTIDASAVTFLDCRGLRFLVRQAQAARRAGRTLVLRRPARPVRRVLDLAGARGLFTIVL